MWNRVPSVVKTHYPASQNQNQNFTKNKYSKEFLINPCMQQVQTATQGIFPFAPHRQNSDIIGALTKAVRS